MLDSQKKKKNRNGDVTKFCVNTSWFCEIFTIFAFFNINFIHMKFKFFLKNAKKYCKFHKIQNSAQISLNIVYVYEIFLKIKAQEFTAIKNSLLFRRITSRDTTLENLRCKTLHGTEHVLALSDDSSLSLDGFFWMELNGFGRN